jgi:hypothetical protein
MHCGVRGLDRRGPLPLAAGQCRGRDRPPVHFDSGLHGSPPGRLTNRLAVFRDLYSSVPSTGRMRQCWASPRLSCSSSRS